VGWGRLLVVAGAPDELNKPLGLNRPARKRFAAGRWLTRGAAALVMSIFVGLGAYVMLVSDPNGGKPVASAGIVKQIRTAAAPAATPEMPVARSTSNDPVQNARDMEAEAGVTVFRPGSDAPGSVVIKIAEPVTVKLAPAPDKRLVERSRHGQLPKTGEDGSTSVQVYARPASPGPVAKPAGRIAILVGGMGISQSATADAIARLPGPVSLAFAPYGSELERNVAKARGDGHEVFLQVPMEPFDYPDNDPGPHTLLTGPKAAENLERLHWTLARFSGYVGIVNFMGGRFTADESSLVPMLKEIASRGLMVVDDGSSQRSLMATAATAARAPTVKADIVLDAIVQPQAIDRELARIDQLARERGIVVASATALPMTVERISRWTKTLEAKGLVLVPVSSVGGTRTPATTGSLQKLNR
jgi:uncharacterized protein